MSPEEFERAVEDAVAGLPAWVRRHLRNVPVICRDVDPDDPELYGLYDGAALTERDGGEPVEHSRVFVFRRPLVEDFGDDPEELAEEIRITVLHEVAHHFGIEDDRLDELGYA